MSASRPSSANGNVLFLILIAVALFAALAYAVTSSTRSGGGDASKEKIQTTLAQIESYATTMQTALQRLMITNGCKDTDFSFYSPGYRDSGDYFNNPGDRHCALFFPEGASIPFQKPPQDAIAAGAVDYLFSGMSGVMDVGTNDTGPSGTQAEELIMFVLVSRDMCIAYNKKMGVVPPPSGVPQEQYGGYMTTGGDPWGAVEFGASGLKFYNNNFIAYGADKSLDGKPSGCYQTQQNGLEYHLYVVLLPR